MEPPCLVWGNCGLTPRATGMFCWPAHPQEDDSPGRPTDSSVVNQRLAPFLSTLDLRDIYSIPLLLFDPFSIILIRHACVCLMCVSMWVLLCVNVLTTAHRWSQRNLGCHAYLPSCFQMGFLYGAHQASWPTASRDSPVSTIPSHHRSTVITDMHRCARL